MSSAKCHRCVPADLPIGRAGNQLDELADSVNWDHLQIGRVENQGWSLDQRQDIADVARQRHSQQPWHPVAESSMSGRSVSGGLARTGSSAQSGAKRDTSCGPGQSVSSARLCSTDSASSGALAAPPRTDGEIAIRPPTCSRPGGGEQRERAGAVEAAHQDGLIGTSGLDHRQRIVRVGFQRQVVPDRIRQPSVPAIETDHPCEAAQPLEVSSGLGDVPNRLDVRGDAGVDQEVTIARTMHLIGDRELATTRIVGLGTSHRPTLPGRQSAATARGLRRPERFGDLRDRRALRVAG